MDEPQSLSPPGRNPESIIAAQCEPDPTPAKSLRMSAEIRTLEALQPRFPGRAPSTYKSEPNQPRRAPLVYLVTTNRAGWTCAPGSHARRGVTDPDSGHRGPSNNSPGVPP